MRNLPASEPQAAHVTVKFGDGDHVFLFPQNATLTELAGLIDVLGAEHAGSPISIDVEIAFQAARTSSQSRLLKPLSH